MAGKDAGTLVHYCWRLDLSLKLWTQQLERIMQNASGWLDSESQLRVTICTQLRVLARPDEIHIVSWVRQPTQDRNRVGKPQRLGLQHSTFKGLTVAFRLSVYSRGFGKRESPISLRICQLAWVGCKKPRNIKFSYKLCCRSLDLHVT